VCIIPSPPQIGPVGPDRVNVIVVFVKAREGDKIAFADQAGKLSNPLVRFVTDPSSRLMMVRPGDMGDTTYLRHLGSDGKITGRSGVVPTTIQG
jgi:hypothetical protein